MNDIVVVEIVHSLEDLSDGLRGVFLCESSLLTDAVEKLSSCGQLRNDIVFILNQLSTPISKNFGQHIYP